MFGGYVAGGCRLSAKGADLGYLADFLSSQYSRLSARASQLAWMMLLELPTVRHWFSPSLDSMSTLTCDSVPALSSRMRTL